MIDTNVLAGLRNGQTTDLTRHVVRNADAVLLLLNSMGGVGRHRDLKAGLRQWRPGLHYNYLFQSPCGSSGYGFVGTSFLQESNQVHHLPRWRPGAGLSDGHMSTRRTYYYRTARGVYSISAEGYRRLAELNVTRHPSPVA